MHVTIQEEIVMLLPVHCDFEVKNVLTYCLVTFFRLKFLTRKWQRATRKISVGCATVNGHGTGPSTG